MVTNGPLTLKGTLFLCCRMHAPGLQGMPNDTRISCCPANLTPLHFCWACSASSAELMSTKANPREDPEGAVKATWMGWERGKSLRDTCIWWREEGRNFALNIHMVGGGSGGGGKNVHIVSQRLRETNAYQRLHLQQTQIVSQ